MKAITVWQPWATLISLGAKPYEFRSWQPPTMLIGQKLAIHAGARPVRASEVIALIKALKGEDGEVNPCLHKDIALPVLEKLLPSLAKSPDTLWGTEGMVTMPLSHIVCTVTLGGPRRGDDIAREFGDSAGNDSDREGTFNWGWPMNNIVPLIPPYPAKGKQGLWDINLPKN